jgi:VanZ family protein
VTHTAPLVAYLGLIFVLSHQEGGKIRTPGPSDKLIHVVEYVPVGVLAFRWWVHRNRSRRGSAAGLALIVFLGLLFAITDEAHQSFVPGRSADWLDVVADAAGVAIGGLIYLRLGRRQAGTAGGLDPGSGRN